MATRTHPPASLTDPLAYSYIRFSTPEQRKGDSLRRQLQATREWCERHKVRLDDSTTFKDLGKSAFTGEHRKNPDRNALAAFLKLVESGKIPKGSFLVIENLDRLTREDERAALRLWMDLLDAGVNIVQLSPETVFRHEKSDMIDIMRAIIELSRGHGESQRKSERNGGSWKNKVECARKGEKQPPRRRDSRVSEAISDRLPAWVEVVYGKKVLIPERAAIVKYIFQLAVTLGVTAIVKRLTDEEVPAFGDREQYEDDEGNLRWRAKEGGRLGSGSWTRSYVADILTDERAVGRYQPRDKDGKPDGPVIEGYFPAAVTPTEFDDVRAARRGRSRECVRDGKPARTWKGGRTGHVNLFTSMVVNARDPADLFFAGQHAASKGGGRLLVNGRGGNGSRPYESFPLPAFEQALLAKLQEIKPAEILNGDHGDGELLELSRQFEGVEAELAEAAADMDRHGFSAGVAAHMRRLEAEKARLAPLLADAQHKAANPLSAAWGELQTLAGALAAAPDPVEARLRLRAALRRTVSRIVLLVVPRGAHKLAAVQVWFSGEKRHRDYLIYHHAPWSNAHARRPSWWGCVSLAEAVRAGDLDLRTPDHAAALEADLQRLDVAALRALLRPE
jgi:DNA invertase Pin-like site-specific DNA recombinase